MKSGWTESTFGEFASLHRGYDLPKSQRRQGCIPVIGSNGIVGHHDTPKFNSHGVTVGRSGSVGKSYYVDEPYWPLNTTLYVEDFHGNNRRFIEFFCRQFDFSRYAAGVSVPTLNRNLVHKVAVSVPPLPEQKKIAAVLLKIQQAIEMQGKIIQSLRDLKKSTMQHLFTYGLRGEKTKMTEIGEMPASWDVVPLAKMGKIGNGSTPKRTNQSYWHNGTIPWLTSGKIHEGEIFEPDQFVTQKAENECHLPRVRKGGLLVAITGQGKTLGNAAIVDFDSTMNQHLAYIQPDNPDIHPPYVWQFLTTQYNVLRQIGFGGGSTKGALTCADLRIYPIPLPKDIEEQEDIANTLRLMDKNTIFHKCKKTIMQDLFKTTLKKLITGEIGISALNIDVKEVENEK